MTFSTQLQAFQNRTVQRYHKIRRASALELFTAIILDTPVDKGVLRNNWFADVGSKSLEQTDNADQSGKTTIARVKDIVDGASEANPIFFTNNLPYATRIEFDGYSGKAPQGMVRVNTSRWPEIVRRNARQVL